MAIIILIPGVYYKLYSVYTVGCTETCLRPFMESYNNHTTTDLNVPMRVIFTF